MIKSKLLNFWPFFVFLFLLSLLLSSCARYPSYPTTGKPLPSWMKPYTVNGKTYYPLPSAAGYVEECYASWYGPKFHGKLSASGEVYNMYDFTAAHKILPLGTYVLVQNLENGRQVIVRINDRGPFVKGRCIDLSYAAAKALGMLKKGVARVRIIALAEGYPYNGKIVYKRIPNIRYNEFFLQVGAFRNKKNAIKFKKRIKKAFPEKKVKIEKFYWRGKVYYRVQIYLARDLNRARLIARNLKFYFPDSFIVAK